MLCTIHALVIGRRGRIFEIVTEKPDMGGGGGGGGGGGRRTSSNSEDQPLQTVRTSLPHSS